MATLGVPTLLGGKSFVCWLWLLIVVTQVSITAWAMLLINQISTLAEERAEVLALRRPQAPSCQREFQSPRKTNGLNQPTDTAENKTAYRGATVQSERIFRTWDNWLRRLWNS